MIRDYTIQKIDTDLYVKGFSGKLVYLAMYVIIGVFLGFVILYILAGALIAVLLCCPCLLGCLYRLQRIQKLYGANGWEKKRVARQLPGFIFTKRRLAND